MAASWRRAAIIPGMIAAAAAAVTVAARDVPTYSKNVAPILQKKCQVCHRPGEAGPFSLLTYADARQRAAKIKDALVDGKMPPWFADPHYGKFSNAMGLSASEKDTILKWVDGGAPEGDRRGADNSRGAGEQSQGGGRDRPDVVNRRNAYGLARRFHSRARSRSERRS